MLAPMATIRTVQKGTRIRFEKGDSPRVFFRDLTLMLEFRIPLPSDDIYVGSFPPGT